MSTEGGFRFEVNGSRMLVWSDRLRATALVPLVGSVGLFRDHIPRLVRTEYGVGSPVSPEEERSTT
jgi:hypothetical protein